MKQVLQVGLNSKQASFSPFFDKNSSVLPNLTVSTDLFNTNLVRGQLGAKKGV